MTRKYIFDAVVSIILIALLSPFFLLVALVVYFSIGRPIFFSQLRPGINGKIFRLYKFRTMRDSRDEKGELLPDDLRTTALGRFLRFSSLDELPELLHVLIGDMSLVGPRPLLKEYLPLYSEEQRRRHEVHPGITGWAQVNGRNAISWEEKFELDLWYVDNRSFWLDIKILFMTLKIVVTAKGVSPKGSITSSKFKGSDF